MWNNFPNHPKRGGGNRARRPSGGYRARGGRGRGGPHHWSNHNSQSPPLLQQQFSPQQLQQPHFGNGNAPQFSAFSDGSFAPSPFMHGGMDFDRPLPSAYRHHSGRSRDREPHFTGHHVSRPKRFLSPPPRTPQRPPSPLPGSDEYRQRNIQHTSELIKRQLLGDDSIVDPVLNVSTDVGMVEGGVPSVFQRDTVAQHELPSPQRTNVTTEKRKERSKIRTSRFEPESSSNSLDDLEYIKQYIYETVTPLQAYRSIDVHEIHQQIVRHISSLSYNKKANIVNQVGNTAGYDVAILQIQKQKRLELSRALRDLCSSNIAIDPDSDVLNDIIPDIGIKLEDLPREVIEELSSLNAEHPWNSDELTYKQDIPDASQEEQQFLSDYANVSPPLEDVHMGGENSCYIDSNIVDPELCFKQAEQLISGFDDDTSHFISPSPFDATDVLYDNGIIGEFSETVDELPSVEFTEENRLFCDQVPEIHEGDAIDSFVEQIPELHTCGYSTLPTSEIFSDQISDIKDDLPCSSVNCDFSQPPPDSFNFAGLPCAELTTVSAHPVTLFQNDTIPQFEEEVPHIATDLVEGFADTSTGNLSEIQLPQEPPPPVAPSSEDISIPKANASEEPSTEIKINSILISNSISLKQHTLSSPKSKISMVIEKSPKLPPSIFQEESRRKPTKNSVLNSDKIFKKKCNENAKSKNSTPKDLYCDLPPTNKIREDTNEIIPKSTNYVKIPLPIIDGIGANNNTTEGEAKVVLSSITNEESKPLSPLKEVACLENEKVDSSKSQLNTDEAKPIGNTPCSKDVDKSSLLNEELKNDKNNARTMHDELIRRKSVSATDKSRSLIKADARKRRKSVSNSIEVERVPLNSDKRIEKAEEVVDSSKQRKSDSKTELVTEVNRLKSTEKSRDSPKRPKSILGRTKPATEVIRLKRDRKIENIVELPKALDKVETLVKANRKNDTTISEVTDLHKIARKSESKLVKTSLLNEDFATITIRKSEASVDVLKPARKAETKSDKPSPFNEDSSVKTNRRSETSIELLDLPKTVRKAETKLDKSGPLNEDSSVKINRKSESSGEVADLSKVTRKAENKSSENTFVKTNRKIETSAEVLDLPKAVRKSEIRSDISSPLSENPFVKTNRKIETSAEVLDLPKGRKSVTILDKARPLDEDLSVRTNRKNEKPVEIFDLPKASNSETKYLKSTSSKQDFCVNSKRKDTRAVLEIYEPTLNRKSDKSREFKNAREVVDDFPSVEKSRSSNKRLSKTPRKTKDEKINARQRLYDYINSLPLLNSKLSKSQETSSDDLKLSFKLSPVQTRSPASLSIELSRNPENPNYDRIVKKSMLFTDKVLAEDPEEGEITDSPIRTSLEKRLEKSFGIELPDTDLFNPSSTDIEASESAGNSNEGRLSPMSRRMDSASMNPFADMEPHNVSRTNTHAAEAQETAVKFGDLKTLTNTLSQSKPQDAEMDKTTHEEAMQLLNPNRPYLPATDHQYRTLDEHIANSNINGNNCANCIHCREKLMKEEKRKARKKELGVQKIKLKRKKVSDGSAAPTAISIDIPSQEEVSLAPPTQTSPKKAWRSPAERKIMPEQSQVKIEQKSVYEVEEEALDYEECMNETEDGEKADSTIESDLKVIPLVEIKEEKDPIEPTVSTNILEQIDVFNKSMEINKSEAEIADVSQLTEGILKLNNISKHIDAVVTSNCVDAVTTDTGQMLTSTDNNIKQKNTDIISNQNDCTIIDLSETSDQIENISPRLNKVLILENISLSEPSANKELDAVKQSLNPDVVFSVATSVESDNNSSDVVVDQETKANEEQVSRASDSKSKGEDSSKHESRSTKPSSSSSRKQHTSHSSSSNKKSSNSTSSKGISSSSTKQSSSSSKDRKNERSSKQSDKDRNQQKDKDNASRSRSRSSDPNKSSREHSTSVEPDKKSTHYSHKSTKDPHNSKDKSKSKKDDGKSSQSKSNSKSSTSRSKPDAPKRSVGKSIMIQTDETKRTNSHTQTELKRSTVSKYVQVGSVKMLNKSIETDPKPEMVSVRIQTDDVEFENTSFSTPHKGKSKKNVLAQMRDIDREIERLLKLKSDLYRRADIYSDESDDDHRHGKESRTENAEDSAPKKSRRRGPKRKSDSMKDEGRVKTRRLRSQDHVHMDEDDNCSVKDALEISLRDIVDPVSKDDSQKRHLRTKSKAKSQADIIQHILEGTEPSEVLDKVVDDTTNSAAHNIVQEAVDGSTKSYVEVNDPRSANNRKAPHEGTARTRKLKSLAEVLKEIDDVIVSPDIKVLKPADLLSKDADGSSKLGMKTRTRKQTALESSNTKVDDSTTTIESIVPEIITDQDSATNDLKTRTLEIHKESESNNSADSIIENIDTQEEVSVREDVNTKPNELTSSQSDTNVTLDDSTSIKITSETDEQNTTVSSAIVMTADSIQETIDIPIETIDSETHVVDDSSSAKPTFEQEEPTPTMEEPLEEVLETNKRSEDDNDKDSVENTSNTSAKDIWLSTVQEISLALYNRNEKNDEDDGMLESVKPNEVESSDTSKDIVASNVLQLNIDGGAKEAEESEDFEVIEVPQSVDSENDPKLARLKEVATQKSTEEPKPTDHCGSKDVITQSRMARRLAHKNAEAVKIVETRKLRALKKTAQKHIEEYIPRSFRRIKLILQETESEQGAIIIDSDKDLSVETNFESQQGEVTEKTAEQNLPDRVIEESQNEELMINSHSAEDNDNSKVEKSLNTENSLAITIDITDEHVLESVVPEDLHLQQKTSDDTQEVIAADAPVTSDILTTKTHSENIPCETRTRKRRRRVISISNTSTTDSLKIGEIRKRGRGRPPRVNAKHVDNNASLNPQEKSNNEEHVATEIQSSGTNGVYSEESQTGVVEQSGPDERQRRSASISSLCPSDGLENLMEVAYEEPIIQSENTSDHKGPKRRRRRGPKPQRLRSNSMSRKLSISLTETIDCVARNVQTIVNREQSNPTTKEYTLPEFPNVRIQFKNSVVKMIRYSLTGLLTMKANLLKPPVETIETIEEATEEELLESESLTSHLDIKCEPRSVESHRSDNDPVIDDEQPPSIEDSRLTIPYTQSEYEDIHTSIEMPNLQVSTAMGHERKEGKTDIIDMDVDLLEEITTDIISDLESQMGIFMPDPCDSVVNLPNDEPGAEPSTIVDRETFGGCVGPIIAVRAIETYVLGSSDRGTLYIYDLATSTLLYALEIATKPLTALCIVRPPVRSSDNKSDSTEPLLYTGALDRTVAVVDYKNGVVKQRIPCNDPVQCMEYKWGFVFIGTYNGSLRRLNTKLNHIENSVSISNSTVLQLKAAQEGARRVLLVATRNQAVSVRDAMTGLLLRTMDTTLNPTVYTLLCDRSTVYCGTSKHDVLIYGFHDGQLIHKLEESNGSGVVCLTSYKKLLFTGCYNGNIYAYKLPSNQYVGVIPGPGGLLLSMDILDDKIAVSTRLNFKSIDIPDSILAHGS